MEPVNARTRITGAVLAPMSYANIIAVHSKRKKKNMIAANYLYSYILSALQTTKKSSKWKKKKKWKTPHTRKHAHVRNMLIQFIWRIFVRLVIQSSTHTLHAYIFTFQMIFSIEFINNDEIKI